MQANEVTQADRERAADHVEDTLGEHVGDFAQRIRRGEADDEALVQAFARHRQQAEDAMRERCLSAAAGEKVEAVSGDESDEAYNRAIDDALAAIRAATLSKEGEVN